MIIRGTTTNKAEGQWKEGNKIRAELNGKEIKRTIKRINKSSNWFFEKNKQD